MSFVRYAYDLYPADDPRDGTRLRRFTNLLSASYRGAANGTGSGKLQVRGTGTDASYINPSGLQYVRVVRLNCNDDGSIINELVIGGIWLESGDFELLTRNETKRLDFSGAGTLAYLDRAVMWSHTYVGADGFLSSIHGGMDPFDGKWRLYAQGAMAGGNFLGAILWRVVGEALSYNTGTYTHTHKDGISYTDSHSDDRTQSAIPDLVITFTRDQDSSGNPWTLPGGEFEVNVGDSILEVVHKLMDAGLYVEMDPDTFELRAWEAATHRTTRTNGSWATGKVRFQSPTGGALATGNIKDEAKRAITARIRRSSILAGGTTDIYAKATASQPVPWEGFIGTTVIDPAALMQLGNAELLARNDAGDTLSLPLDLVSAPTSGKYVPFEDVHLDDVVSVHTGTGQWDLNERAFPVAALGVELPAKGTRWTAWIELGASFVEGSDNRSFQAVPLPVTTGVGYGLCTITSPGGELLTGIENWTWEPSGSQSVANPGGGGFGSSQAWGNGFSGFGAAGTSQGSLLNHDGGSSPVAVTPGANIRISGYFYAYNTDVRIEIKWYGSGGSPSLISTELVVYNGAWPEAWTPWAKDFVVPPGAAQASLVATTAVSGGVPATGWVDEVYWSNVSVDSSISHVGELTGVSNQAARCDHAHHLIRDVSPTADDDISVNIPVGTIWLKVDDIADPATLVASWICINNALGAAVWAPFG